MTATAQGKVAPMSSVGRRRELALTTSCTTWTKDGESDQRSGDLLEALYEITAKIIEMVKSGLR